VAKGDAKKFGMFRILNDSVTIKNLNLQGSVSNIQDGTGLRTLHLFKTSELI
jgi:hypothetical protein